MQQKQQIQISNANKKHIVTNFISSNYNLFQNKKEIL